MLKYWTIYNAGLSRMFVYYGPLLIWSICSALSLIAVVAVWQASQAPGLIATYTKDQLITYAVLGILMMGILNFNPFPSVRTQIKDGTMASRILLKPVSFFFERLAWELSWKSTQIFFNFAVFAIGALLLFNNLVFPTLQVGLYLLIPTMIFAALIQFTFAFCMALFSFWFTEVEAIGSLRWIAIGILGGSAIPISFIPQNLQWIIKILPFRYMFSFPMEIIFGKVSGTEIYTGILVQGLWLVVLIGLYKLMLRSGIKSYVSVGH